MKMFFLSFIMALIPLVSYATAPEHIVCARKDDGYLPYNKKTNKWIGSGNLEERGDCNKAIDTYKAPSDIKGSRIKNYVCSSHCDPDGGCGWAIFDATTGKQIGQKIAYWYELSTCQAAVNSARAGVVCVPRNGHNGIYDILNNQFVGDAEYFEIAHCAIATAWAQKTKVCAVEQGNSAVFSRRYNEPISAVYFYVNQCTSALSNNSY